MASKRDYPNCNKTDCFAYNNIVNHCILLKGNPRDKPVKKCSFYESDPQGIICGRIERDVKKYTEGR